jgi:hypothetical protein
MKPQSESEMRHVNFDANSTESAIAWMLDHRMIMKTAIKDPETFAAVSGYLLSDDLRDKIGSNLVKLFAKSTRARKKRSGKITVRDAFLAAAIGATLEIGRARLSEEEMMRCANIVMALLPIGKLEADGIAEKSLRSLARDSFSVGKIRRAFT